MKRSLVCWVLAWSLVLPCGLLAQEEGDSVIWSIDLENVVVTGQYAPTDARNVVHEVSTINREMIDRQGATNLEQLLQQNASIRINQDAVLGSSMSLLGIDGQNVKIMIDGVPIIGRQDGNIDLGQINLQNVERIEIVEGPLAVNYGTDALAGVINLISKKSQLKTLETELSSQLESRGEDVHRLALRLRPASAWMLHLNGGYDQFDGYGVDTTRSVVWNPKDQWYGEASLRYNLNDESFLRYSFRYFDEEVANLGDVRRPQFKPYAFDDFYRTQRQDHQLLQEGYLSDSWYLQSTLSYNRFDRYKQTLRQEFDEDLAEPVAGQQDTSAFTGIQLRSVIAARPDNRRFEYQLGIDLRYDNAIGQRIADTLSGRANFADVTDYAAFASVRYRPARSVLLESGLRYAYNTRFDAPLIPSLHGKWELADNWRLKASYAQGFRSPDLKELFFNFIDINHFIVGNPGLLPERSHNTQLSLQYESRTGFGRPAFRLKAFYNDITDKIELFETSTLQFAYFNQAEYKTKGLSLSAQLSGANWQWSSTLNSVGYFNELSRTDESVDPFTYTFEWSNQLTYSIPGEWLTFSAFARLTDRRISFYPDVDDMGNTISVQQTQDGYWSIDASILGVFWQDRLQLTTGVRNLLDVQAVNLTGSVGGTHSGGQGSRLVSPGRSFFVRAAIRLATK